MRYTSLMDLISIVRTLEQTGIWFVLCMGIFVPLSFLTPNIKGQRIFRKGFALDVLYWVMSPYFQTILATLFAFGVGNLFFSDLNEIERFRAVGFGIFASSSFILQFFIVLFVTNLLQYWIHRVFHGNSLWKFHAIHHSSEEVDWLSTSRFHPINSFLSFTLVGAVVSMLGFSSTVYYAHVVFNVLFGSMVHSNLDWSFGPLKYVIASPVFHRWHHTLPDQGGDKNFSPIFPFIDVIFGTFYMPKGKLPERFGTQEKLPGDFVGQLMYPFRAKNTV